MTYTWFLFDADGTLFDYDKAEAAALAHTFAQFACWYNPSGMPRPPDMAITYEIRELKELLTSFCPGLCAQ